MTTLENDLTLGAPGSASAIERTSPLFHRRVLDRLPTALIVVDESGVIVYGNEALERLVGWSGEQGVGSGIFEYIHPDDLGWLAEAFVNLANRDPDEPHDDRPWVPINFRLVARSGAIVPVEVTGRGSLDDSDVQGIIYEIRPAYERGIVHRVLAGVASGGDLIGQLELVVELISASMIEIDSAVLRVGAEQTEVLTASNEALRAALLQAEHAGELGVFRAVPDAPQFCDVATIASGFGAALAEIGYQDAWNLDVASVADDACYRIVGFTKVHHVPAMGVRDRLTQAGELTSVILLRMHTEQLLDRAAHHDALTGLPNLLGLHRRVNELRDDHASLAILFVDLDGFKSVNDEHGHQKGDEVLTDVAQRMVAAAGPDHLVARLGGDEFAIVLAARDAGVAAAAEVSERIIEAIEAPLTVDGRASSISASVGVVEVSADVDLDTAISAADRAMYEAKRAGGGQLRRAHLDDG